MSNRPHRLLPSARHRWQRRIYRLALLAALAQLVLIVASWLVTSAEPTLPMRSLLSRAGIRWYFGNYVDRIATPWLVYILLLSFAWGCMRGSQLWSALRDWFSSRRSVLTTQEKFALVVSLVFLGLQVLTIALLTLLPHAILLSVTGSLWPSSFSRSVVPIVAFMAATTHALYDVLSGEISSLDQMGRKMAGTGSTVMPLLLCYCLLADLVGCMGYVFGG